MSFTREKRQEIRLYLLGKIDAGDKYLIQRTCDAFQISDKTVYRYLKEMTADRTILKSGRVYTLNSEHHTWIFRRDDFETIGEDRIYRDTAFPLLSALPKNVREIWDYTFTEMVNNAIDHAEAEHITITLLKNELYSTVMIVDDGIGIFRKIREHFHLNTQEDAIEELFKGKLTTDSARHSGEGIFFTSRMLDQFAAASDGRIFSHDKFDDVAEELKQPAAIPDWDSRIGTIIYMRLSNRSNRHSVDVFDRYADVDNGFTRTNIPLKNLFDTYPVSRSQAKRLCRNLDKFADVELDFSGVETIGQGFAHELFVVFQKQHPEVQLIPFNTNVDVQKMIYHVSH